MKTLESAEVCRTGQAVSPDVAATAEVLRSLYLPHECRHMMELLQLDAAPSPASEPAAPAASDEMFLDLVETRLAGAATPMLQIHRMRDLRDLLQVQVWFLDALQDRLRQASLAGPRAGAEGGDGETPGAPPRPARAELAELLRRERARYAPAPGAYPASGVSRAIQEQLRDECDAGEL